MRTTLAIAFVSLLATACVPPASQTRPNPPGDQSKSQAETEPFISHTAVFFPQETKDFELTRKYRYPVAGDGVQLTYNYAPLPKAEIDFFVFAVGRAQQDVALKAGMNRIRGEISAATKAGMYIDTAFADESDVNVLGADGGKLPGRRLQLRYTIHDVASLSVAYMFYKQLYFVELRITAPASAGADALLQAGDLAANEIVPGIHMLSEGTCETVDAHVGAQVTPDSLLAAITRGVAEREAEGCPPVKEHPAADFQPKQGEDALQLSYSAADWQ